VAAFRVLLVLIFVVIAVYTAVVVADHGMNLFAVFFGDMAQLGWPGQFNLDFMCMLMLSGLWVAWRHAFSGAGLALAVLAALGGATFLSVYLFIVTGQAKGDMREVLLGKGRAAGASTR
jgi:hypothetical protein